MGSAAKLGLLILMALVIALARFLEGEVKPRTINPKLALEASQKEESRDELTGAVVTNHGTTGQPVTNTGLANNGVERLPAVVPLVSPQPSIAQESQQRRYTVKKGDTLAHISQKCFGTTRHWQLILNANASLAGNAKGLKPGMELVIPEAPAAR